MVLFDRMFEFLDNTTGAHLYTVEDLPRLAGTDDKYEKAAPELEAAFREVVETLVLGPRWGFYELMGYSEAL